MFRKSGLPAKSFLICILSFHKNQAPFGHVKDMFTGNLYFLNFRLSFTQFVLFIALCEEVKQLYTFSPDS